jgi:hypothetical protein
MKAKSGIRQFKVAHFPFYVRHAFTFSMYLVHQFFLLCPMYIKTYKEEDGGKAEVTIGFEGNVTAVVWVFNLTSLLAEWRRESEKWVAYRFRLEKPEGTVILEGEALKIGGLFRKSSA